MGDLAFVGFYSLIIYIESIHVGLGVFFFLFFLERAYVQSCASAVRSVSENILFKEGKKQLFLSRALSSPSYIS